MIRKISLVAMGATLLLTSVTTAYAAESMVLKANQGARFDQHGAPGIFRTVFLYRPAMASRRDTPSTCA